MAGYKPKIIKPVKPRRMESYTFPNGNNGGMNCAVPADRIRPDQSPDMLNMCYRDGALNQRYGFDVEFNFAKTGKPIQGMSTYRKADGSTLMLVVCDGQLITLGL